MRVWFRNGDGFRIHSKGNFNFAYQPITLFFYFVP